MSSSKYLVKTQMHEIKNSASEIISPHCVPVESPISDRVSDTLKREYFCPPMRKIQTQSFPCNVYFGGEKSGSS